MTKKEMIESVKDYPDNAIMVLAKDAEGNSFSPLYEFSVGRYRPTTTYSGGIEIRPDKGNSPAIILWPTN